MKNYQYKLLITFFILAISQTFQSSFANSPSNSPYIDKKNQTIKALPEQTIQQLLSGEGMGFALAAELNEYPGPKHVLELQTQLSLSIEQVKRSNDLFIRMNEQARELGKTIIQAESELEELFQTNIATPNSVENLVMNISQTQAKLRSLHLITHIHQLDILTPEQNILYQQLRGYKENSTHSKNQETATHSRSHKHTH